jgi:hypothetical protein
VPSRSLTFHQEIRDAIAARDRLVLVVGPQAAASLYVQQEWQQPGRDGFFFPTFLDSLWKSIDPHAIAIGFLAQF